MQGCENQRASQRNLDNDAGRFRIAHIADHVDVMISALESLH